MSEEQTPYEARQAHTPGPWIINDDLSSPSKYILIDTADGSESVACVVQSEDAHLIAAAPDLLEALSRMVERYELFMETGVAADAEESKSIHLQMRAAIAKAKGEPK